MNSSSEDHADPKVLADDDATIEPVSNIDRPAEENLLGLREQLQELRGRFDATDAQIAGYLRSQADRETHSAGNGEVLSHLQQYVDRLLSKFDEFTPLLKTSTTQDNTGNSLAAEGTDQAILDAINKLGEYQKELAGKIVNTLSKRMTEDLDLLRFQQVVHETMTAVLDQREAATRSQTDEQDAVTMEDSEADIVLGDVDLEEEALPEMESATKAWSRAIWGSALVESAGFAPFLGELNRRLLEGDNGIANLAGQLLVFRQAPPEGKPQLLKDVGEAYYRTRLDEALPEHPLEQSLIGWLEQECDSAGLPNRIEVVHVGERFDKSRHSSMTRGGVEVAEVHGWVVLTEGGRVYTRASVASQ